MAQVHQFLTEVPRFPSFFEDSVPGSRCGGVRKASTVLRQVATAGDPNRLLPSRSEAPAWVRTAIELFLASVGFMPAGPRLAATRAMLRVCFFPPPQGGRREERAGADCTNVWIQRAVLKKRVAENTRYRRFAAIHF